MLVTLFCVFYKMRSYFFHVFSQNEMVWLASCRAGKNALNYNLYAKMVGRQVTFFAKSLALQTFLVKPLVHAEIACISSPT